VRPNPDCISSKTKGIFNSVAILRKIKNSAFLDDVNQKSNHMFDTLNKFKNDYDFIGDVRGYGLMIGIEIIYPTGTQNRTYH
jgi:4-aminobutyrate aminotransferase-like enzyme